MKVPVLAIALIAITFAQDAPKPPASVKVSRIESPKALKFEVVVPAKLDDVWTAFTTTAGLNTWLWQDCTVDLRKSGEWLARFPGGSTGGGTIVSFEPKRQLVIHAMAP